MAVLKRKRQKSKFEVMHHYYCLRREVTDFTLRDFGYSREKADKKIQKMFQGKSYKELSDSDKQKYIRYTERDDAFDEWFVIDERTAIINLLRDIGRNIFSANDIRPMYTCELEQRRIYQEKAIADCEALKQELQYTIQTLPVDVNKFTRFAQMIDKEVALIKGWRKSDNSFKDFINKEEAKKRLKIDEETEKLLDYVEDVIEDAENVELDEDQTAMMKQLKQNTIEYKESLDKEK